MNSSSSILRSKSTILIHRRLFGSLQQLSDRLVASSAGGRGGSRRPVQVTRADSNWFNETLDVESPDPSIAGSSSVSAVFGNVNGESIDSKSSSRYAGSTSKSPARAHPPLEKARLAYHPTYTFQSSTSPSSSRSSVSNMDENNTSTPKTILLIKKPNDDRTSEALRMIIRHLRTTYATHNLNLIVEENAVEDTRGLLADGKDDLFVARGSLTDKALIQSLPDLTISLGGDGTILHVSSLFGGAEGAGVGVAGGSVPPVLSFSMGSLGFLLPFHIDTHREAISDVMTGQFGLIQRMRLTVELFGEDGRSIERCPNNGWQVMNEVALHRGRFPHLSVVDAFVNGQHLTEAVADGLILATPTGSTAYSLSAGGPIMHPSIDSFLLTPIAPRSLSFRTLLLPSECLLKMQISQRSRAPSELSMDGREVCMLNPGEYITVSRSAFPVPCVTRPDGGDDWVADINTLLQFNTGFKNKSLWRHTIQ